MRKLLSLFNEKKWWMLVPSIIVAILITAVYIATYLYVPDETSFDSTQPYLETGM